MTSVDESTWWEFTNYGKSEGDLYSIAIHEIGHALVFNPGHDGFAGFREAEEVRDSIVKAYYGSFPYVDSFDHLVGSIDPISKRGGFGNDGIEDGRWLVTKLHLLVAQATGYVLRDTSPFRELSLPDEPLAEGSVGVLYTHTMNVVGGIPAYYWTIDSGALPDGLSLDSFTGTISGTPQESGRFEFTIRVRDNTEGDPGVTHTATLDIEFPQDLGPYDVDNDGRISRSEVVAAARDYFAQRLSKDDVDKIGHALLRVWMIQFPGRASAAPSRKIPHLNLPLHQGKR